MAIVTQCPKCGKRLKAGQQQVGRQARCPLCKQSFTIQAVELAADADGRPSAAPQSPPPPPIPASHPQPPLPSAHPVLVPAANDKPEWYLRTAEGAEYGPVSRGELDVWLKEDRVDAKCQVFKEGWKQWQWAEEVFPQLAKSPEPAAEVPAAAEAANDDPLAGIGQRPTPEPAATLDFAGRGEPPRAGTAGSRGDRFKRVAASTSEDALNALKLLAVNPVGGLQQAYEKLGPMRAMIVGIVFGVVFILCVAVGSYFMSRAAASMASFGGPPGGFVPTFGREPPMSEKLQIIFKSAVVGLIPLVSIALACTAVRMTFQGKKGSVQGDIFVAGTSLLPLGFWVLISGFIGIANIEVTVILMVFAFCATVLILYSGCTKIHGIPEGAATWAVPTMLVAGIWLSKVLATTMGI